jgi:hypothetical protein
MTEWDAISTLLANSVISGGLFAFTGGVIGWLWKTVVAEKIKGRIKHEYETKIALLKSELSVAAAERQIRFSRLDERRAKVIAEVYKLIRKYKNDLFDYVYKHELAEGISRNERRDEVVNTLEAFKSVYEDNRIWFPQATMDKLDDLSKELESPFNIVIDSFKCEEGTDNRTKTVKRVEVLCQRTTSELEHEFRMLLGDETAQK